MPLGNALVRLVASIVEPERSCVVSLTLDDVAVSYTHLRANETKANLE